ARAVDGRPSRALDDVIDGARRLAMRLRAHAGAQQLQVAAECGYDRAARARVEVFHEHVVVGVALLLGTPQELGMGGVTAIVPVPCGWPRAHGLRLARERLEGKILEVAHEGRVQAVGPDDGLLSLITVIVPGEAR